MKEIQSVKIIEEYNPKREHIITISPQTQKLLEQATKIYHENSDGKTWYGRCIFLSWFCTLDCKFCFRAARTDQAKKKTTNAPDQIRGKASVALEALFCKKFNWRIEFLTGGYGMMPFEELIEYAKLVSEVYGEKIWLNVGILSEKQIKTIEPYIKGICASIETCSPALHKEVCPKKPIEPYQKMFDILNTKFPNIKKSIAVIVGMSNQTQIPEDINDLFNFVEKNKLDRVTMYALKPVRGSIFTVPPTTDEYVTALAKLRIRFPKLQIIAGTNLRRCHEADYLMKAGASAITKFPATKQFATDKAHDVTNKIKSQGRTFTSNLTNLPKIDWNKEIDCLNIDDKIKIEMKNKLPQYLHKFQNPTTKESNSACFDE